ncbi:hypothetical protein MKW98_012643 [Papaver atlanticum]|uniref:ATPase AAA-type core domain-containing protein n=1 Tax=Papaver atlanticum TaxID=357466 RepID=A0AAD4T3L1_9MAGN|nr:hypothetical protein MKW98_012643 [Papaver atlanticum]
MKKTRIGCYFKICFEEKHKEFVDSAYLSHIAKEADIVKFKNRGKKLFTNRSGESWSQKEFYTRVGKAWKRGYLLYGPPGTGKTSLIAAIANYLDFDIYDMELTAVRSNAQLRRLLISTTSKSVIVVEDIDCSLDLSSRKKKKKNAGETKSFGEDYLKIVEHELMKEVEELLMLQSVL